MNCQTFFFCNKENSYHSTEKKENSYTSLINAEEYIGRPKKHELYSSMAKNTPKRKPPGTCSAYKPALTWQAAPFQAKKKKFIRGLLNSLGTAFGSTLMHLHFLAGS
jgi:hypothetical protein